MQVPHLHVQKSIAAEATVWAVLHMLIVISVCSLFRDTCRGDTVRQHVPSWHVCFCAGS